MATSSTHRFTHAARGTAAAGSVWAQVRSGLVGLIQALARELELRRAMRELATLDDYMLHDIGLTRSDIEREVRFGRN
jgi:uncharacterized protein YjiS (DUF1127 family)